MNDITVERNTLCSIINCFPMAQIHIHVHRVTSEHFHFKGYGEIFDCILNLAQANKPINFETVWHEISVKLSYFTEQDMAEIQACRQDRPEYWIDLLSKIYMSRRIKSRLETTLHELRNPSNVYDLLSTTTEALFKMQTEVARNNPDITLDEVADNVGISHSKYTSVNNVIMGYPEGRPAVIGARPGQGKTTYACNEVLNKIIVPNGDGWYKYGDHATFFSLEMSRAELIRKLTCIHSGIPEETVRRKQMTDDQKKTFALHFELVRRAPLMIYDRPHTPGQVCSNMRYQAETENTKLVVLDFFQRLKSNYRKDRQFFSEASNDIADGLKNLCSQPAMLVLSQLSREAEMNTHLPVKMRTVPKMSHLKETGSLEEDAYQIGLMYLDPETAHLKYNGNEPPFMFIDWGKNRGGNTGRSKFRFIKHKGRFQDA